MPLPETPGHSQASLAQSLVGSLLLSPGSQCTQGSSAHKVLFVLSKSLFPQSPVSSVIKSHWPSKSNSLGFSVPFLDLKVRKSVAGPRTFITVRELLWDNCSPVCGSPAQWLYTGANGNLVQEDLCASQVCCSQSPCPRGRPLLTCASAGDTQRQVWLSLL